jgi:NTE family protein
LGGIGGWKNVRGNTPITPLIDSEKCSHLIVTHLTDGSLWDRQAFPDSTILEIRPRKPIKRQGMVKDLLGFNADNIQSWIEQGYEDTQRCVRNVKSALESRYIATQAKTRLNQTINRLDNDGFYID